MAVKASLLQRSTGASGVADDGWCYYDVQHTHPRRPKGHVSEAARAERAAREEQQGQPQAMLACLERLVGVEIKREARVWEKPARHSWQVRAGHSRMRAVEDTGIE